MRNFRLLTRRRVGGSGSKLESNSLLMVRLFFFSGEEETCEVCNDRKAYGMGKYDFELLYISNWKQLGKNGSEW